MAVLVRVNNELVAEVHVSMHVLVCFEDDAHLVHVSDCTYIQ